LDHCPENTPNVSNFVTSLLGYPEKSRKLDVRLPGKGNPNSHGARPVHLTITMIKWIRTSRLSIKISLSLEKDVPRGVFSGLQGLKCFEAHRLLYHSTPGVRVRKKKKKHSTLGSER